MQAITDELAEILKSKFQAGARGFRARFEVGRRWPTTGEDPDRVFDADWTYPTLVNLWSNITYNPATADLFDNNDATPGFYPLGLTGMDGWDYRPCYWATASRQLVDSIRLKWAGAQGSEFFIECCELEDIAPGNLPSGENNPTNPGGTWRPVLHASGGGATAVFVDATGTVHEEAWDTGDSGEYTFALGTPVAGRLWRLRVPVGGGTHILASIEASGTATDAIVYSPYPVLSASVDKSLTADADAFTVTLDNHGAAITGLLPNMPCRLFQWFGDLPNAVKTFYGLIDTVKHHREPRTIAITGRDWMKKLLAQNCDFPYPQGVDADGVPLEGAVRDETNGVYLGWEISAIVADLLDKAGWDGDARAITATGITVSEFIAADGQSYANEISKLADLAGDDVTGYLSYVDEDGTYHFEPDDKVSEREPDYTFDAREDIHVIDPAIDDLEAYTRVRAIGPMTVTQTLDAWDEAWESTAIAKPAGIWYDPSDTAHVRVLDRGTRRIYRLKQSDQTITDSVYIGAAVAYPLGLSGDPGDSAHYWVLDSGWVVAGILTANYLRKFATADNSLVASYPLPNGRWSAVKVSAAYIWLTNFDTDARHKYDRTTVTEIASHQLLDPTTGALLTNPTGIAVNGTDILTFYGGYSYETSESAPTTITRTIKSATGMAGAEWDTTSGTDVFVGSDSLGRVWKYAAATTEDVSYTVFAEAVDTDFEDELEARSGAPERRLLIVRMDAVLDQADAQATADRWLSRVAHDRETFDFGVIGNPAIQKTDKVRIVDPVLGISRDVQVGTYRTTMSGDGTYLGVISATPWEAAY